MGRNPTQIALFVWGAADIQPDWSRQRSPRVIRRGHAGSVSATDGIAFPGCPVPPLDLAP